MAKIVDDKKELPSSLRMKSLSKSLENDYDDSFSSQDTPRFELKKNQLGPFMLGMTLGKCLEIAQNQPVSLGCIEVCFPKDVKEEQREDEIVVETGCGLRLHFESYSQRLTVINLFDISKSVVLFRDEELSTKLDDLTSSLGDMQRYSFSAEAIPNRQLYHLPFELVHFIFRDEKDTPELQAILLFHGPPKRVRAPKLDPDRRVFEPLEVYLNRGVKFTWSKAEIPFGMCPQGLITALGPPEETFFPSRTGEYFYNYFSKGLDFLFDGEHHRCIKIVLHSNAVFQPDFGTWSKCNWRIHCPSDTNGRMQQWIDPKTRWSQAVKMLCPKSKPEGMNPFQSSIFPSILYYPTPGAIFEISNDVIQKITLFQCLGSKSRSRENSLIDSAGSSPNRLPNRSSGESSEPNDQVANYMGMRAIESRGVDDSPRAVETLLI